MHSLPAVCIVTFVLMDYLYHFCRQFFVLPGFIEIPGVSLSALYSRMKFCLLRIHRRF